MYFISISCQTFYIKFQTPNTTEGWKKLADGFSQTCNFPHVVGALDGKHIRITCPPGSGSYFFNYKNYFSIILMGLVDSNYQFTFVDVGAEGKASDGGVWKQSTLFQQLNEASNPLNFPDPDEIVGIRDPKPYFIVADDAFALSVNLLKPYGRRFLTKKQVIFNYRLSRARIVVENTFGILSTRFRILRREIEMRPEGAEKIVMATVVLHNMLRQKAPSYIGPRSVDYTDENHDIVEGLWRREPPLDSLQSTHRRNPTQAAQALRDRLSDYFLQREGELSWQYRMAFN